MNDALFNWQDLQQRYLIREEIGNPGQYTLYNAVNRRTHRPTALLIIETQEGWRVFDLQERDSLLYPYPPLTHGAGTKHV